MNTTQINVQLDAETMELDAALVRSWCRCEECGDTTAGLRWASPAEIEDGLYAASVGQRGDVLDIEWSDGHRSQIDIAATFGGGHELPQRETTSAQPDLIQLDYGDVVDSEAGLLAAFDLIARNGGVHIVNGPADPGETVALAELFAPVRTTSYGAVQVFITSPDAHTAAHTGRAQHPHTDEPFRYNPPGLIFFHSIEAAPVGQGTSLLVDGFAVAEQLRESDPAAFDTLASVPVEFHRRHEGDVQFSTRSKVISVDWSGAIQAIRINNRCIAPIDPRSREAGEVLRSIISFSKLVEDPANQTSLHLCSGEFLVFDNHRLMHGRTAFSDDSARHLRSCNVDKDEVHSRHRVLAGGVGAAVPALSQGPIT